VLNGAIFGDPEETIYVFDEAHHLHRILQDLSSGQFTPLKTVELIEGVHKSMQKHSEKIKPLDAEMFNPLFNDIQTGCEVAADCLSNLHHRLKDDYKVNHEKEDCVRLRTQHDVDPYLFNAGNLITSLRSVKTAIGKIKEKISSKSFGALLLATETEKILKDAGFFNSRIEELIFTLDLLVTPSTDEDLIAKWIEEKSGDLYSIHCGKVNVDKVLEDKLWSKAYSAILTSATITALNSFDTFIERMGLHGMREQYLRVHSPFDYFNQGELILVNHNSNPSNPADYTDWLCNNVMEYIPSNEGSLLLFSSYIQMNAVYDAITPLLKKMNVDFYSQAISNKETILKLHQQSIESGRGSVIFGSEAYAEGIDMKGNLLTNLVITKVPFPVPVDPVSKTLEDSLKRQGRIPFMELVLPNASTKLVQSVGRLIRTKSDKGRCVVLDNRLLHKHYGKRLISALPPFKQVRVTHSSPKSA
jgi:ATP-dependent DNA helicase DinG